MNTQATARAVLGPFTAREVTLLGGTVLLALASLLSFGRTRGDFAVIILALLAPLAVAGAVVARRLGQRLRVDLGSFSLEQIAAVVSVVAFVVALGGLGGAGSFLQFLAVVGSAAMVVATFGAHWIRAFSSDFADEPGTPLLRRDVLASAAQPGSGFGGMGTSDAPSGATGERTTSGGAWFSSSPRAGAGADAGRGAAPGLQREGSTRLDADAVDHTTVFGTSVRPQDAEPVAFWFAVPDARPAFNRATGATLFTVEPGTWWLAVRTVPEGLVVRHDDGREALLRDTTDLERG